ncbi:MAG TPA: hypothetical protein VFM94_09985 [Solirubrobacterales bacterium]|nr:hypothetical protein [Solirubrobacterales bacterium]
MPVYALAIDGAELQQFVPDLLEGRYPGRSREVEPTTGPGHFGWILELDDCVVLVRASQVSNPFIWIRGGIAHAIPRSEALATHVAAANKDLMVGRAYMACGDEMAMVVFDEAIVGAYLSLQHEPSIRDVVNRFETSLQYTSEWARTIREKFGGQAFTADDWHLMSF